ncbi:MAG: hypothetical protein V7708_00840 [Oceanicoccus sp.]
MEEIANILSKVGWPHITLVFGLVFIWLFKTPISAFLSNVDSVSKDGISTKPSPEAQNEDQKKNGAEELLAIEDSEVIKEIEASIVASLTEKKLETGSDTDKVLIRHLAITQLLLEYERIHGSIFGSQIFLLKRLNEVAGQGKPRGYIEEYYLSVQERHDDFKDWEVDEYLYFLGQKSLITIVDDKYHISKKGVEYLIWLAKSGRNENRAL